MSQMFTPQTFSRKHFFGKKWKKIPNRFIKIKNPNPIHIYNTCFYHTDILHSYNGQDFEFKISNGTKTFEAETSWAEKIYFIRTSKSFKSPWNCNEQHLQLP